MAFERYTTGTDVISQLSDRPNDSDRLDAAGLKAKFDEAVTGFVSWVNNTLIAALEARTASGNIGFESEDETFAGDDAPTTVKAAFEKLAAVIHDMSISGVADGGVTTVKLHDEAVTEAKLAGSDNDEEPKAVSTNKIQLGAIVTRLIADSAVTGAKIADGAITAGKIADGAVTSAKLATGAAIANIASGGIATAKLADLAVTAAKLAANAVETAKIKDLAVTTAKIANSAVTYAKTSGVQKVHGKISNLAIGSISAGGTRSVTASGVTASNTVIVSPAPGSWAKWRDCGVRCSAQAANSLTFTAETATGTTLYANVVILD